MNELLAEGSLQHVHILDFAVNLHTLNYIWIVDGLERRMHECLIKV